MSSKVQDVLRLQLDGMTPKQRARFKRELQRSLPAFLETVSKQASGANFSGDKPESEVRRDLAEFLAGERDLWRKPQGGLLWSERRDRLDFAETYATGRVREWLHDSKFDLESLVDSHPHLDRSEFVELISGVGDVWGQEV
jgi:hypothetical protein